MSEGMRPGKMGVVALVPVFGLSYLLVLVLVLLITSAFVFAIRAPPRVLLFSIFVKRRRRH